MTLEEAVDNQEPFSSSEERIQTARMLVEARSRKLKEAAEMAVLRERWRSLNDN